MSHPSPLVLPAGGPLVASEIVGIPGLVLHCGRSPIHLVLVFDGATTVWIPMNGDTARRIQAAIEPLLSADCSFSAAHIPATEIEAEPTKRCTG
jgi:hypothetical protein